MARVLSTKEFDTWEKLLPKAQQEQINRFIAELKVSYDIGKPLGYPFFREKRIDGHRIYFLIYEDVQTVLLVTVSDKKAQQETIDGIREKLDFYRELVKNNL